MIDEVKTCVNARINSITEYLNVPADLQSTVDTFVTDITSLGETCQNAKEFEEKFVSSGLSDTFMSIFPKCTAKPHKMTKEEKDVSRNALKDLFKENKDEIIADAAMEQAKHAATDARIEIEDKIHDHMADKGILNEYYEVRNAAQNVGLLGKIFGKRNK